MLKNLYVLISVILLAGCSTNDTLGNTDEFPPSMTGHVFVNDTEYTMKAGGYRWERKKGLQTEVVTTDSASPYQIAESYEAIPVEPNEKIEIKIEKDPEISVYTWDEEGRGEQVQITNNRFNTPTNKEQFIYEVAAKWPNGEVSYTFVIDVE